MTEVPDDPVLILAYASQTLLLLGGIAVLIRLTFGASGRALLQRPSPLPAWSINAVDFVLAALAVFAGGVVGQVTAGLIVNHLEAEADLSMLLYGGGFQSGLLLGAAFAAFASRHHFGLPADAPLPPPLEPAAFPGEATPATDAPPAEPPPAPSRGHLLRDGFITLLAALPLLFAVNGVWVLLLEALNLSTEKQPLVDLFAQAESPLIIGAMALLAVGLAPLAEELIFRAGLFRYLRTRVPTAVALCLPALIFASLHGNLVAFGPLLTLGVVFAVAYERTGRIGVPIVAHALFNLNTILMLLAGVEV